MNACKPGQRAATVLIAVAAFATLIMAAYQVGAVQGRGRPLPAPPLKHGVAFRLHSRGMRP